MNILFQQGVHWGQFSPVGPSPPVRLIPTKVEHIISFLYVWPGPKRDEVDEANWIGQHLIWIVIERHCFKRELLEDWGTQLGSPPPGDLSQQRFDAATKLFCLQNLMLYNLSLTQSISILPAPLSATLQVNATLKSVQTQESNTVGFVQGKTLSSVMNMEM